MTERHDVAPSINLVTEAVADVEIAIDDGRDRVAFRQHRASNRAGRAIPDFGCNELVEIGDSRVQSASDRTGSESGQMILAGVGVIQRIGQQRIPVNPSRQSAYELGTERE